MPRRPRIHLDGVPLHIVQRGHNREPCFFAEDDYSSYLRWLGEALNPRRTYPPSPDHDHRSYQVGPGGD